MLTGARRFWRARILGAWLALAMLWLPAVTLFPAQPAAAAAPYDWLQFSGDPQHSGNNSQESLLSAANVSQLQRAFQVALPAAPNGGSSVVDSAPVFLSGIPTPDGTHNLAFLTTNSGQIVALDADTGALVWQQQPAYACTYGADACYTKSSPAIDPNRQFVYGYGLDGYVHKYAVGTGLEVTTGGWPEMASAKPRVEKESSALSIASAKGTSYLYVTFAGSNDAGDYQGHITTINLTTGSQHTFNMLCSDQVDVHFALNDTPDCPGQTMAGIWGRPGVVYDPDTGTIYASTGNGDYNPAKHDWADTMVALRPDGTGMPGGDPLDNWTPTNYATLQKYDIDIGSASPVILPVPAGSQVKHLGMQGGKDGHVRLVNLDNLSGQGGPGHVAGEISSLALPQDGQVQAHAAVWTNPADGSSWVFVPTVGATGDAVNAGVAALRVTVDGSGMPALSTQWSSQGVNTTSLLVANGVLYAAGFDYAHNTQVVRAVNPTTGSLLWQDTTLGRIHWQSPVVANGRLYIADGSGVLTAYQPATDTAARTVSGTVTDGSTLAGIAGATVTVSGTSISATTKADGSYTLQGMPGGSQSLTAAVSGYNSRTRPVTVPLGGGTNANFSLTYQKTGCMWLPETGHNLCAPFLDYWQSHGLDFGDPGMSFRESLALFGFPVSEAYTENGYTVQYFERARFEYHPEFSGTPYVVEEGLLGDKVTFIRRADTPFLPIVAGDDANCNFYAQTGHRLCFGFRSFWSQNGGLAVFGYPLTEEFQEKSPTDGQTYTVQYFERARFEYHTEFKGTVYEVEMGLLGAQVYEANH